MFDSTAYRLVRLNGSTVTVRLGFTVALREEIAIAVNGETMTVKKISSDTLLEYSNEKPGDTVVAVIATLVCLAGLAWAGWYSISSNVGVKPDADVMAAARQVSPLATVSDSEYSFLSGCDSRDSQLYRVMIDGKQKAIICAGPAIFIGSKKAPTLRFQEGK
jgi:hypothetical protein